MDVDVQHTPQGVLPAKCERFMRGGVHELLVECGFSRMPQRCAAGAPLTRRPTVLAPCLPVVLWMTTLGVLWRTMC